MSILNVLLSVSSEPTDITIFGIRFSADTIIRITFMTIIPFYYGLFFSKTKQYYLSSIFFLFSLFSIVYYQGIITSMSVSGWLEYIKISEINQRFTFLNPVYFLFIISFCVGVFINWVLEKYDNKQQKIILILTVFTVILMIFNSEIASAIVRAIDQYKINRLEPDATVTFSREALITMAAHLRIGAGIGD